MRIKRLEIENYRSIKHLNFDVPQICALVGPNNAGKSNILTAIYKVLGREWVTVNSFDLDDVYGRDPVKDMRIVVTFDPPMEYRRFKNAEPVEIPTFSFEYTQYKVGENKGQRRLEQTCLTHTGKSPMVLKKAPKSGEQHQYEPVVNIPSEVRAGVPLIYIGTNRSLKEQLPSARYSLLRQLLEDVDRDLHELAQTVTLDEGLGSERTVTRSERFRELMTEVMELLSTDSFVQLESAIKENALRLLGFDPVLDADKLDLHFSPFDTIEFYKTLDLRVREGEFTISATELGDGVQNAVVLAILQAFEARRKQGAILLIEEPEMFLHPQMQRTLYKTLRQIGATNQVIYTTHSPHFVAVPEYDEVALVRKADDGTFVTRSDLPAGQARREKLRKELDPERNELFFATRVLFVEGDTEKLAFPEYARRLGLDLDKAGASIVEVGGKRNLLEFCRVAKSFGIPFGVVYDEDSREIDDKSKEAALNEQLDALGVNGNRAWRFVKRYEDELRSALGGERGYQEQCQEYPNVGKPTKARLIAADSGTAVPEKVRQILSWLSGSEGATE
ncbi:MAG: AAA family ATPase [Armatimonadetes bacterium]|nr:AAA family ATPase [Armatimonadota bacterium]